MIFTDGDPGPEIRRKLNEMVSTWEDAVGSADRVDDARNAAEIAAVAALTHSQSAALYSFEATTAADAVQADVVTVLAQVSVATGSAASAQADSAAAALSAGVASGHADAAQQQAVAAVQASADADAALIAVASHASAVAADKTATAAAALQAQSNATAALASADTANAAKDSATTSAGNAAASAGTATSKAAEAAASAALADSEGNATSALESKNAAAASTAAALIAKTDAESARDAALIQAGVYTTEALGRAAVADGQAFKVQGSGDVASYEYRRISAGASVLLSAYPSVAVVKKNIAISGYATPALGVAEGSGVAVGEYFWVRSSVLDVNRQLWQNVEGIPVNTGVTQAPTQSLAASAVTLFGAETQGFALDATTNLVRQAVKVIDTANPSNNYEGNLAGFLETNIFSQPKIVTLADGSMAYSAHNILKNSEDFTLWTKPYVTVGARDANGLSLITAASTNQSSVSVVSGIGGAGVLANAWYTASVVLKPGTSPYICFDFQSPSATLARTWVNVTNGTVGTVAAGVTVNVYTTEIDGTALPAGELRVELRRNFATAGGNFYIYLCDADNSINGAVGKTLYLRRAQLLLGLNNAGYAKTGTTTSNGIPYDFSRGGRRLLTEPQVATFYNTYSEDLTQAVWAKTGCTPLLNATGPTKEPCTTLTATAADATCLQATTGASVTSYFQVRLRRVTGTGTVSITADGGTTWLDVTSKVGSTNFGLAYTRGTAANPTIGLKLGTSGDAVEVALACVSSICSSPLHIYAAARTRAADFFRVPLTKVPAFTSATLYVDFELAAEYNRIGVGSGAVGFGSLSGAGDYHIIGRYSTLDNIHKASRVSNVVTSQNYAADMPANLHIEGALRITPTDVTHSINGAGEVYDKRATTGSVAYIKTYGDEPIYIKRLLMVPTALADDVLAKWRYSGDNADARYVADIKVQKFGGVAGADNVREPAVEILSDTATESLISVAYVVRNNTNNTGHLEMPCRVDAARFKFNKLTGRLSQVGSNVIIEQQANWASGLGHTQGIKLIKIKHGDLRGRLLAIYTQLISANGMLTPTDHRVLYSKYSDDDGVTWSAPTLIKDKGDGTYSITSGGDYVQYPMNSAYPGRIVFPYYGAGLWAMYSDDGGATWAESNSMATATEPMLSLRPDGKTLVMMSREGGFGFSVDGGATFTTGVAVPGYSAIGVGMSNIEGDIQGVTGRAGQLLMCGTRSATPNRSELTIERLAGLTGLTLSGEKFMPLGRWRGCGYVSAKPLSGGWVALAYESSVVNSVNLQSDIRLMIVKWGQP